MEKNLKNLKKILIHRLIKMGIEPSLIPGFVRVLTNSLTTNLHINLQQVNKRLKYLGWDEVELDYHTLSLAVECFEEEGFHKLKYLTPAHANSFLPL